MPLLYTGDITKAKLMKLCPATAKFRRGQREKIIIIIIIKRGKTKRNKEDADNTNPLTMSVEGL